MPRNRKTVGAAGEASAIAFLEARDYRVVDANVRPEGGMARGELDIIAWHGDCLVFVEVKTRRVAHGAQGTPSEAIDARKRRQLVALAISYLAHHALDDVPCRFDVVEVIGGREGFAHFRLLPNAFDATDTDVF
jgi:putative endonuclease